MGHIPDQVKYSTNRHRIHDAYVQLPQKVAYSWTIGMRRKHKKFPLLFSLYAEAFLIFVFSVSFTNLLLVPGWYPDEGSDVNIAQNLGKGQMQYFAVKGTPLVAARTPLFHLMLIGAAQLWGYDIHTARLVIAIVNLITLLALFSLVNEMLDSETALLSSVIWFTAPLFFLSHRIAYIYNVQTLFVILGWWFIWKFSKTPELRWVIFAALAAGAAYMTTLLGLGLLLGMVLIIIWHKPRYILWFLPIASLPGLAYLTILYFLAPDLLLEDLTLQIHRGGGISLFSLYANNMFWFDWAGWIGIGLIGLFLIEDKKTGRIAQSLFLVNMIFTMRFGPGELSFHHFLPLLPFLSFGAAHIILKTYKFIKEDVKNDVEQLIKRFAYFHRYASIIRRIAVSLVWILVFSLIAFHAIWDNGMVMSKNSIPINCQIDKVLVNPEDALIVTEYVNQHVKPQDIVIASPHIAWRIKAKAADFEQLLAYHGLPSVNYSKGIPKERFTFAPSLENAKFVIVDPMLENWAIDSMPDLNDYYATVTGSWKLILKQGKIRLYLNPTQVEN